ncbi:MAG: hypothetical protein EOO43_14875 [Flavobacterium sp.]|nr:MAG: hypothetical protein EOO43_14875 [Flavobacterium sp.]
MKAQDKNTSNSNQNININDPAKVMEKSKEISKHAWGSIFDHTKALEVIEELFSQNGEETTGELRDFLFDASHYIYDSPNVKVHTGEMNSYIYDKMYSLYYLINALDKTLFSRQIKD